MRRRVSVAWQVIGVIIAATSTVFAKPASAQTRPEASCIKYFFERSSDAQVDPTAGDAEKVIEQVATSLGLRARVVVIPCNLVNKAEAYVPHQEDGVPPGEYIMYDPDWYREVIGRERMQGIWIFGHELAHILNRDFTARRDVPQFEKETSADLFAGCAVAKMKGDVKTLEAASRSGYD